MYKICHRKLFSLVLLPMSIALDMPAYAVTINENLDIGGAVRARVDYDPDRDIEKLSFDTFFLTATYNSSSWIGAAKYRFYGKAYPFDYTDKIGDISFAEYAWIGYKFDESRQVQAGLNKIPFGLQPYFGSPFFESLGNVIGLEDIQDLGIKYIHQGGDWNLQAGYYLQPADQGQGTSRGGKTYATSVAAADDYVVGGSNNKERDIFVGRVARNLSLGGWQTEVGVSALTSTLENRDSGEDGRRHAVALHYHGKNGPWGLQLQATRQDMRPRNPESNKVVSFGSFDGTFNVASRGNLYVADLSYDVPGTFGWLSGMKVYGNYSRFEKDEPNFDDSQRFILGTSFSLKDLWIAVEWLHGKNDPYIGGSSYTQSLGSGGSNQWENQLYTNIGYYF
ncbi:porin [Pseudomonas sp. MBLB4136]|uniref:porin n=1 Tax=Pseudomonas sp. MBLB4136 TaxID=3451558 RepID=UPI003F75377C